jgi:hypothetical protein
MNTAEKRVDLNDPQIAKIINAITFVCAQMGEVPYLRGSQSLSWPGVVLDWTNDTPEVTLVPPSNVLSDRQGRIKTFCEEMNIGCEVLQSR